MATLKDFAPLHSDYQFFEEHSDEAEKGVAAWVPLLAGRKGRLLDFGCGSGSFTSRFLEAARLQDAELVLIEPDEGFCEKAVERLRPSAAYPLEAPGQFDLIVSHHVLYYVPDLEKTLKQLLGGLARGGRMLLAHGGARNGLCQLLSAGFASVGEKHPYWYSEDTQALLESWGTPFRLCEVSSRLDFPDSSENRMRILRFLFAQHLERLPDPLSLFDPYLAAERVVVPSVDELFVIDV